ncbi:hypothetical protein [Phytomonospora endophytica]|uniref:Uncharacterized protein n=1 Tax=Phytomonospora endophytica TaxID=714109 RepID=A0A841FTU0_9ACTN|nr:hypothetical protein [Phytomonospora endophytica]MBB6039755.1 hypothetical protein [Phytomonospora endophytica]GIG70909.1 hypothetical protein Pen01_72040 [Phytomonospora endophytica]
MPRRPRAAGVAAGMVPLIAIGLLLRYGPLNALTITVLVLCALITGGWTYVWIQRLRGGFFVFADGFVDAVGMRIIAFPWTDVMGIIYEETGGLLRPSGRGAPLYRLELRSPADPARTVAWGIDATYAGNRVLAALIARHAGVSIEDGTRRPAR